MVVIEIFFLLLKLKLKGIYYWISIVLGGLNSKGEVYYIHDLKINKTTSIHNYVRKKKRDKLKL